MAEIVFVNIPQETVNDESVRILSWKVPSGSAVEKDQQLCEVETSKAVMDIEAPIAGTAIYTAAAGDEVAVGSTICQIVPAGMVAVDFATIGQAALSSNGSASSAGTPEIAPVATRAPLPLAEDPVVPVAASAAAEEYIANGAGGDQRPARLTALALKVAVEFGLDKDSFPRGSLVRRDDVLRKAGKLPPLDGGSRNRAVRNGAAGNGLTANGAGSEAAAPIASPVSSPAPGAKAARSAENEPVENAPVTGAGVDWTDLPRRKIFEGRVLAQGHARTVQSSVTTSVRAPRLRLRLEKQGLTSVGLGALVIFEAARLLRKYPEFNAIYDRGRIGQYRDVNVGWAIDGGQGLMVPVVPQADRKTPYEIVDIMHGQIDRYIDSALSPADFLGGTFTISDLSSDGITHFHPLISQGQAAILGVGGEVDASGDETLYLTLAFDHQLTEGKKAGQFVRELVARLEAHAALEAAPVALVAAPQPVAEPYCALCQRSGSALLKIKEMLVRSEVPAGFVCSVCLAGQS
ncbi:MAG TPA: 2-oxo acid dehydrogenase subunit E2 [Acidisarcina sp.]